MIVVRKNRHCGWREQAQGCSSRRLIVVKHRSDKPVAPVRQSRCLREQAAVA
jgi:hypothetical protein